MKSTGSLARTPAWISAGIAALMTAGYLALIATEGDNAFWEVFPWATLMLVGSVGLGFLIAAVVAGIAAARTEPATSSS